MPSNCKVRLQTLDLSVNKPLKDHLRNKFQSWYLEQVSKQLEQGKESKDSSVSVMKPHSANWIISAIDYLRSEPSIVRGGFVDAGIVEALDQDENNSETGNLDEDQFQDLDRQLSFQIITIAITIMPSRIYWKLVNF